MRPPCRVLVSTSLRSGRRSSAQGEEIAGSLLIARLDAAGEGCELLREVEVPSSPHRPGRRSVRGTAAFAGGIAVCNSSQLFLFDRELRRIEAVRSDPAFVTATASDSVVGLDGDLEKVFEWWAGEEPELTAFMAGHHRERWLRRDDFRLPSRHRDRFHINQVCFDAGGDMIVSLPDLEFAGGVSKFWNVTRRRFHLAGRPELRPLVGRIHDGLILGEHHYLGWTEGGRFLKLCASTGRTVRSVDCSVPLGASTGNPVAEVHGWLRGAAHLGGEVFLVGQSLLTLFLVDMERGERSPPLRWQGLAEEPRDPGLAIYCISCLDPD